MGGNIAIICYHLNGMHLLTGGRCVSAAQPCRMWDQQNFASVLGHSDAFEPLHEESRHMVAATTAYSPTPVHCGEDPCHTGTQSTGWGCSNGVIVTLRAESVLRSMLFESGVRQSARRNQSRGSWLRASRAAHKAIHPTLDTGTGAPAQDIVGCGLPSPSLGPISLNNRPDAIHGETLLILVATSLHQWLITLFSASRSGKPSNLLKSIFFRGG